MSAIGQKQTLGERLKTLTIGHSKFLLRG